MPAEFGMERGANFTYLHEIVSDRYALLSGMQVLHDELQFADARGGADLEFCGADLDVPSVVTTLAFTNCGDRIHQGESQRYRSIVAARFATLSELGDLKVESFSPFGGGTDESSTLAHVTVAHQLDAPLRQRVYDGNAQSYVLVAIDLKTHVGRDEEDGRPQFGITREAPWREPRAACGAMVGALKQFDEVNPVHRRLRRDLGEENFALLTGKGIRCEGVDITAAVASAIIAIRGLVDTARSLTAGELDERGVGHLTASMTVNRVSRADPIIYLARAIVFGGEIMVQGLGLEAKRYGGTLVSYKNDQRLILTYDDQDFRKIPIRPLAEFLRPA
ncbi:hypothetical protein BH09MYX1_BH09MYX1_61960 [soil metagenome]